MGVNALIDRVGGVICHDIKGHIAPINRCGNIYLINFVDHNTDVGAGREL